MKKIIYECVDCAKVFWWLLITYLFESIVEKKRENFEDVQKKLLTSFSSCKNKGFLVFTKRKGQLIKK